MNYEAIHGIEFLDALDRYMTSLVEARDFAAAVRCYEDHRRELETADGATAGSVLRSAAMAYASQSNYPAALKTARLAQHTVARTGDSELLAEIFLTVGSILRDTGEWKEAEKAFRDAESVFRRNDHLEGQSRALNLLAGLFYRQKDFRNALSVLMDAMELARVLNDREKLAYMMGNIGRIETFAGDFRAAEEHLRTNIELSTELGDRTEVARARLALAYAYIQQDKHADAEQALADSRPHLGDLKKPRHEIIYLTYLGELYYRMGRYDESAAALNEALRLAESDDERSTLTARVLRHLAELAVLRQQYTAASRYVNRALALLSGTGSPAELGALWKIKGMVADAQGVVDKGRHCFQKAIELLKQSGVQFEKALALRAAGVSTLFSLRRRLTYLFRAEEFYRRSGLNAQLQEIGRIISRIDRAEFDQLDEDGSKSGKKGRRVEYLTECERLQDYLSQIPQIGRSDLPLLLIGETGVGKDHLARYYRAKVRPDGPFVPVNCASVPETLLESELFGYRKGAFTGAVADKPGLFAVANGGVLYLDEIGDMPLALQAKLLGVLERRELTPLGETRETSLDIKLVVATNSDLVHLVESGVFRSDLYYRLSGITFQIPPLRERKEDIPVLLRHFMTQYGLLGDRSHLSPELVHLFLEYEWPGNVRELENKVRRLQVMAGLVADGDLVELCRTMFTEEDLPIESSLFERVEQFERKLLVEALLAARGNKSQAARILRIHEATVRAKAKRYGINLTSEGRAYN